MPTNVVKTPHDEHLWEQAKSLVKKDYPKVKEGSKKYWKIVMGIYKQSKGVNKSFDSQIKFIFKGKKLHYKTIFQGLPISVENRKGSIRRGKDENGEWQTKMKIPYGYIRGTLRSDGDHLDCFIGPNKESDKVYVIHIKHPESGKYDEDKVFLGFETFKAAMIAFKKHYDDWEKYYQGFDVMDIETFKDRIEKKGKKIEKALFTDQELKNLDKLEIGTAIEMEHTNDPKIAKKIAEDHIEEDSEYYSKLMDSGIADIEEVKRGIAKMKKPVPAPKKGELMLKGIRFFIKSHVKGHTRATKTGKVVLVREYENSKTKDDDFELPKGKSYFLRSTDHPELDLKRKTSVNMTDVDTIEEAVDKYGGDEDDYIELDDGSGIGQVINALCGYTLEATNYNDAVEEAKNIIRKDRTGNSGWDRHFIFIGSDSSADVADGVAFIPDRYKEFKIKKSIRYYIRKSWSSALQNKYPGARWVRIKDEHSPLHGRAILIVPHKSGRFIFKSHVMGHTRTTKTGKVVPVRDYENKKNKKDVEKHIRHPLLKLYDRVTIHQEDRGILYGNKSRTLTGWICQLDKADDGKPIYCVQYKDNKGSDKRTWVNEKEIVKLHKSIRYIFKSFSSSMQQKYPGGKWITITDKSSPLNGRHIFIVPHSDGTATIAWAPGHSGLTHKVLQPKGVKKDDVKKDEPENKKPELSEQERDEAQQRKKELDIAQKQTKEELHGKIREKLGIQTEVSKEERDKIERDISKIADKKERNIERLKQFNKIKSERDKAIDEVISEAKEAMLGSDTTELPDEKKHLREIIKENAEEFLKYHYQIKAYQREKNAVSKILQNKVKYTGGSDIIEINPMSNDEIMEVLKNEKAVEMEIDDHYRLIINTRGGIDKNGQEIKGKGTGSEVIAQNIIKGGFEAMIGITGESSGNSIMDLDTYKVLGASNAALLMNYYLENSMGAEKYGHEIDNLKKYIEKHGQKVAKDGIGNGDKYLERAQRIKNFGHGEAALFGDRVQANATALQFIQRAYESYGQAEGSLNQAAELLYQFENKRKNMEFSSPSRSRLNSIRDKLKLNKSDVNITMLGENSYKMTIRPTAFEKIIKERPISTQQQTLGEHSATDIKAGKANTNDYLPEGLKPYMNPDKNGVAEKIVLGAHQQSAARLVAKEKRVYLNFEAGTGKSASYLASIAAIKEKTGKTPKTIISMPKKLMPNFSDEIRKFSDFNVVIVDSSDKNARQKLYNSDPDTIVLVNKEKYLFDYDMIKNAGFDMMIVDEAHRSGQREGRGESGMSKGLSDLASTIPYFVAGSVSPETKLFIRSINNSKYEIITIGEFADRFGLKQGNILFGNFNYEIQAFDINNLKIEWMPITGIHRYDASMKKSYLIKGSYGHKIKITEDHSVYVIRNNSLLLLKGNEVKNTDLLIINNEQKFNEWNDTIDLFNYCNMCNYNCYGNFKTEINKYEKGYQRFNYLNQSKGGSYLPYEKAVEYKCLNKTEFIRDKSYGKYGAKRFLDAKEIAYLVGLVIGDGWVEGSKNGWRIGLAIADKDVNDVKKYLDNIGGICLNYTISKYRGCVNIRISCPPLFELFNSWFKGQRSLIKRIPSDVWNWSKDAQKLLLKGIIDSDGHIEHIVKRNRNFKRVSITSISKDLMFDIYCLLKQFDIIGSVYRRKFIKDERPIFKNSKQVYTLRYQLDRIRKRRSEVLLEKTHFNAQNVELIEIDSISEITENDVYDISVKGHENFFGNGILVHNSGTPTPNDLSELYFYLKTIDPEKYSNQKTFMEKYKNLHRGAGMKDMLTEILHKEIDDRVFTVKKDLLHTFKQHIHNAGLSEIQKTRYKKVMEDYRAKKIDVLKRDQKLNWILNSTKFENNDKFTKMGEIINDHIKTKGPDEKILIYAQQYSTVNEIERYLKKNYPGAGVVRFDGKTKLKEIDKNKTSFRNDKNVRFAIHTDAGTEGLNLQYTGKPGEMGATTAIAMASGANSYSTIDQFFSRANRTGVPKSMNIDGHLVLTDTPHDIRTEMRLEDKKAIMSLVDNAKTNDEGLMKSKRIVFVI